MSSAVRVPCLLCTKRDSVASLPIVGGFVVQCCQPCHQQSQANKAKFGNAAKHDFCSQCFYNKSKRTVLYRDQRIATLYTKLDNATQLIVDKEYDKARLRLQKLVQECPGLFAAHYNLACIESLAGNAQESLAHLNQAFLMGYTNFANAAKDPDLANVRKLSSFKPLLKQFEKTPKQPSREVLGQVVAMCDVCAEVLASTSTEAEKKTTVKNLCEQCRHNKAVLKAQLPDGSMMKLCSECAQSISPQAAGAKSSSGEQPQQPPPPSSTPSGHVDNGPPPPPARPANRGPIGGGDPPPPSDEEIDSRGSSMRASGDQSAAAGASMSEIERIVAQEEAAAKEKSLFNQPDPPAPETPPAQQQQQPAAAAAAANPAAPTGPKRLVGAVALMPGIVLPMRGGPGGLRRGPPGAGSPGDPAQRLVAQRGAPPPLSRGPGEQPPAAPPAAPTPAATPTTAATSPPQPAARQAPQPAARGTPPAPAAAAAAAAAGAAPTPLPAGWQEFTDKKTGRNYYYCAATKETVWVRPGPEKAVPGATAAPAASTAATATTTTTATATTTASTPTAAAANDALPAGWQEFTDKKTGRNYYYCAATKETVWVRPGPEKAVPGAAATAKPAATPAAAAATTTTTTTTAATSAAPAAAAAATGPLPAGWVEYMDKQRKLPYYYNAATKQTVWVRPTAESASAAAAAPATAATNNATQVQIMPLDDDDDDDVTPPAADDGGAAAPGQVEVLPLSDDE